MGTKYVSINDSLYSYLSGLRSDAPDLALAPTPRRDRCAGKEVSKCQISDEEGTFLSLLTAAVCAKSAHTHICVVTGRDL